jgi:hypothetical protein
MPRIAFCTFVIFRERKGHEQVQGFFDRTRDVMASAANSKGFVETLLAGSGDAPAIAGVESEVWPQFTPDYLDGEKQVSQAVTLSLWTDLESVFAFAYRGVHGEAFRKRRDWILKPDYPTYVAWWVEDDHIPTREEAFQRLEHIHNRGSSPYAYNFKQPFDEQDQPVKLDRLIIEERIASNETHQTED